MEPPREPTVLFGREIRVHSLAYLYVAGGSVGALTLLLPHDDSIRDAPLLALAVLVVAIGLALPAWRRGVTDAGLHAALAAGTLVVAASNHFVGVVAAPYPIMYSWTVLYAFAFFGVREALAHWALAAVSFVVVLGLAEASAPVAVFLVSLGTPLVTGVLVSRLLERLRSEVSATARRARVLEQSEARTRAIVQAAPNPFATVELDGTVLEWNREAERLFGVSSEEALGSDVAELMFAPEDRAAHAERRRRDAEGPEPPVPVRREVEMTRRDGTRFPAELIVSRAFSGERRLLCLFVDDLTGRRQQERAREQLYREQAARREAERMSGMVSSLQVLLDAALAHRGLEEMLAELIPRVCEVLSADAATILLSDPDGSLVVRASTAPQEGEQPLRVPLGAGISGKVAERGEPMLIQDPEPRQAADPALFDMGSVISVPLEAGRRVTGVIQVGVPAPRRFSEDDLLLLRLAADRVALAIDHARVYEREHRIAETLQRSLLPDRLPRLPGLEVAARYLAAASEAEVGGDWYDVIPIDSCRVGLVMGDVAGKGLAAAAMVGRLRSAMRAYALERHEPDTVVERLNQLLLSEMEESHMATLLYLVVDQEENTVTFVNAGHLPPLVVEHGVARTLEGPSSVPLGVMPFPRYEAGSTPLAPGTTLLLYTDGLVERAGELLDHGLARLVEALRGPEIGPEGLLDRVLAELVPAGAAADDVALLALHNPAVQERLELTMPASSTELASMRALLRRWLSRAEATEEEMQEILTATGEAAANAIEHAGAGEPFEILGVLENGDVDITVRDHGSWRSPSPDRGGGRGLVLMRALMDWVDVTAGPQGTTVRMRRRMGPGPTPE